jgi:hypothetical protein
MESQCLVDIINFTKTKNHFNPWVYLHILIHCDVYVFGTNIYFNITSYEIKIYSFFGIWPTIICKYILKIFHNNDMVEVQTWEPWKIVQCDNNLGPPIWCFHMKYIMSCGCEKIFCPKQNIKKTYKMIVHLNQSSPTNKVTKNLLMVSSNSILITQTKKNMCHVKLYKKKLHTFGCE